MVLDRLASSEAFFLRWQSFSKWLVPPQKKQEDGVEAKWAMGDGPEASWRDRRWLSSFWKAACSLLVSRESRRSNDETKLLYSAGRARMRDMESSSWSKSSMVKLAGRRALMSCMALSALPIRSLRDSSSRFLTLRRAS